MTQTTTTYDRDFSLLQGCELCAQRGISSKVFDLGKSRRQAISYGEPVHYARDGKLEEIDNRITVKMKTRSAQRQMLM